MIDYKTIKIEKEDMLNYHRIVYFSNLYEQLCRISSLNKNESLKQLYAENYIIYTIALEMITNDLSKKYGIKSAWINSGGQFNINTQCFEYVEDCYVR